MKKLLSITIIILLAHSAVFAGVPTAPKVVAPTGKYIGGKPMVEFTGAPHSAFRLKIAKDAAGKEALWDSQYAASPGNSAPCEIALADGTYYTFAQIMNEKGWSAWSKPSRFTVDRIAEKTDIRHMDEPDLLTAAAPAPDDMFGFKLPTTGEGEVKSYMLKSSYCGAANSVLRIEDNGHGPQTDILRRHCVKSVDLNKGVTLITAVRVQSQQCFGKCADGVMPVWERGQILIVDNRSGLNEPIAASFRVMKDVANLDGKRHYDGFENIVGICTDNKIWQEANLATRSDDFLVIRITGKNQVAGDFTSTRWRVYVNESPAPSITGTGCMPKSLIDPEDRWMTADCVVIGQGYAPHEGVWDYDWLAVNMDGDYAPGEWDYARDAYVPGGGKRNWNGPYESIAALRAANETAFVRMARPAVITRIARDINGNQIAYYVQDDTDGIRINSTDPRFVEVGRDVSSISGVVPWLLSLSRVSENVTSVVYYPNPQPEFSAAIITAPNHRSGATPVVMTLKGIAGEGPVTDVSTRDIGKLVSYTGKLVLQEVDPLTANWIYYLDDGTAPNGIDGRGGSELRGLRIVRRNDPEHDPGSNIRVWANTTWAVEGILTYEPNGAGFYVRTIAAPSFTMR